MAVTRYSLRMSSKKITLSSAPLTVRHPGARLPSMKRRVVLEPATRSPKWELLKAAVEEVAAAREASAARAATGKKASSRKRAPRLALAKNA
jgi:hypothetical protein